MSAKTVKIGKKTVAKVVPSIESSASVENVGNGGMRFLLLPVVGIYSSLPLDGAFNFMLRIAMQLIAQKNYCYVVVSQDADTSPWDGIEGLMFIPSSIPGKIYDVQRSSIDTATIGECFSYHYGRYFIDAAIVMTGNQALTLKTALFSDLASDLLPIFCIEQGVAWFDSEPGYENKTYASHLQMLGSSYANMIWVSERDKRMFLDKASHSGLAPSRVKEIDANGYVASVPIALDDLSPYMDKRPQELPERLVALFAARTNSTKHPEMIVSIFDNLYKQGEPIDVVFMTQTSDLAGGVYAIHNQIFDERDYITPKYSCGVNDFYEQAAKSHIYLCWSDSESYNVSVGEAALLGCVFICKDSPNHRELMGTALTDDRFWAVDAADAVEKVRWVLHNYQEAFDLQQGLRDYYVSNTLDRSPGMYIAAQTKKFVMRVLATGILKHTGTLMGIAESVTKTAFFPLKFHDFLALMEKECRAFVMSNQKRAIHRRVPVNWAFHGFFRSVLGLVDNCKNRFPIYTKDDSK